MHARSVDNRLGVTSGFKVLLMGATYVVIAAEILGVIVMGAWLVGRAL